MSSPLLTLACCLAWHMHPTAFQVSTAPLDAREIEEAAPLVQAPEPETALETADPVEAPPAQIAPAFDEDEIVGKATDALEAVQTAKGRFVQFAPDGSASAGDFAIRRPGRMRFEYDDPNPLLLIADGATVAIEDRDLETIDRVPLGTTPLGLVLDDSIDWAEEAEIIGVEYDEEFAAISLRDRKGEAEGTLILEFSIEEDVYDLDGWRTLDEAGGVTSVQLLDVETGMRLNPRLFRIEDGEDEEDRRR